VPADILLLTGSPGSGKSTTARAYAESCARAVHLHTDDFWHSIVAGGIPAYLPEADAQNHTVMEVIRRAAWAYAEGGFTTIVDGVIGPWMLRHFQTTAEGDPPNVHYVVLRPAREVALHRAQGRAAPDALTDTGPVLALWDQFRDLGALERHALDTSDDDPADTLRRVADAVAGGEFVLPPTDYA
jgi:predicted kinase